MVDHRNTVKMSELTLLQEQALATFKTNIHLPGDGFHTLIIELSKEHQLPFQKVRSVVKSSQVAIEKKIKNDFESVDSSEFTKASWLDSINNALIDLAKNNEQVMDVLQANSNYIKAIDAMKSNISSEEDREAIVEWLMLAYEKTIFKPLLAMLHTSPRYWKLMRVEELHQMTAENREQFNDYPSHMEAAAHLYKLDEKVRSATILT